jgi:arginine/ornithine N-succinyltransferase beta subunit
VRTVAQARRTAFLGPGEGGSPALIATGFASEFRLARGTASARDEGATLDPATARLLLPTRGEAVLIAMETMR